MTLTRDQKISTVIGIVTIGFALISIFYYWRGMFMGMPFPDNTFLNGPINRFGDFYGTVSEWRVYHFSGVGYGLAYFPATYLLAEIFNQLAWLMPGDGTRPLMLSMFFLDATFFGVLFFLACKNLKADWAPETVTRASICVLMTYPSLFVFVTGNFEAPLFVGLALFVWLYQTGHIRTSLPFLAFIIAMKAVPAIFLLLLVADKKYKEIVYVACWATVFTLAPLIIYPGGFRDGVLPYLGRLAASQKMYFQLMVVERSGNHFGHSLLNGIRVALGQTAALSAGVLRTYFLLTVVCFAAIGYFVVLVEKVAWKRLALLVCAFCLLPYTSTDYKLVHFFLPLFMFINHSEPEKDDLLFAVLFGLLLIPKSYVKLYGLDFYTTNVVINTGCMLVMLGLIISSGFRSLISSRFAKRENSPLQIQTS
jgi:hypothetical protein